MVGMGFSSASMVASVAAWPVAVKVLAKALIAFPFTFHSLNGVRHLNWDTGRSFLNKTVIKTGWTVVALSGLSTAYLAFFI